MTRVLPPALAASLAFGVCAATLAPSPVQSQQTPALVRGGGSAGVEKEPRFKFSTLGGKPSTAEYDRNVLKVPSYYGEVIAVTQAERRPVLWYRAADGSVRNVILADARSLVRVVPE